MVQRSVEEKNNEIFYSIFRSLIEEEETKEIINVRGVFPMCGWGQNQLDMALDPNPLRLTNIIVDQKTYRIEKLPFLT